MLHATQNIIGHVQEYLPETDSTQNQLLARMAEGTLPEGWLIHTDFQTAGRGQTESTWHSERGQNLLFSFVLYPRFLKADQLWRLNQMISVTLIAVLETYIDFEQLKIKWPNDILLRERKIAGILIQNQLSGEKIEHSVIGIGININQKVFEQTIENIFPPTSLSLETGTDFELSAILNRFCERANFFYEHLQHSSESYLENLYLESLYKYRQTGTFQVKGQTVSGMIEAILPDGRLVFLANGVRTYLQPKELKYN
jgi:BirA family biotin operon repressor/biotin-[acetyl-CoA-carboxylase] ligase